MKELKDLKLTDDSKLKDLEESKLKEELKGSEKKLFTLKMKLELNELKQTHLIKFLRRHIAKVRTIAKSKSYNI